VDRLVDDGLVERTSCSSDARGAEASLTALGLARLRAAAPTHLDGIREYFFSAIQAADLPVIERAMDAVSERVCGTLPNCEVSTGHEADEADEAHEDHESRGELAVHRHATATSPGH
jgi:DNA-binding MarR family transcriptional regulator